MSRARHLCSTGTPLAATLGRVAAGLPAAGEINLSAHLGIPGEPGWVIAADLVESPELLDDIMTRIERAYGTDNRAYAGTSLLRGLLWRALTSAVAVLLTERRLPDLRADNVALRFGESGFPEELAFAGPRFFALPDDPEAGHPDAVVLPSEEALLDELCGALSQTYLPALIPALRGLRVRRGTRALWRVASDVCAETFIFVGRDPDRKAEGRALAEKLLAVPSPLSVPANFRVLEYPGGSETTRVRNACCLYYKLGNGCCFTCPRTTDEERVRRLLEQRNETVEDEET